MTLHHFETNKTLIGQDDFSNLRPLDPFLHVDPFRKGQKPP